MVFVVTKRCCQQYQVLFSETCLEQICWSHRLSCATNFITYHDAEIVTNSQGHATTFTLLIAKGGIALISCKLTSHSDLLHYCGDALQAGFM